MIWYEVYPDINMFSRKYLVLSQGYETSVNCISGVIVRVEILEKFR